MFTGVVGYLMRLIPMVTSHGTNPTPHPVAFHPGLLPVHTSIARPTSKVRVVTANLPWDTKQVGQVDQPMGN